MITTPRFSVKASDYVKAEARHRLWSVAWIPCLLLAGAIIAGFHDIRYWFLGLMLLFIVYPMIVSFTWIALAAHQSMRWRLRPQKWSIGDSMLHIDFFKYPDHGNIEEDQPQIADSLDLSINIKEEARSYGRFWIIDTPDRPHGISFLLIPSELWQPSYHNTAISGNSD